MTQKEAGQKISKLKYWVVISEETDNSGFKFALIESFYSTDVVHCLFNYAELDL